MRLRRDRSLETGEGEDSNVTIYALLARRITQLNSKHIGFFRPVRQAARAHRNLRETGLTGAGKRPKFKLARGAPQFWG
jgi:hypothetical protein